MSGACEPERVFSGFSPGLGQWAIVQWRPANGRDPSAEALMYEGLDLLIRRNVVEVPRLHALRSGLDQADRGELFGGEEVIPELCCGFGAGGSA